MDPITLAIINVVVGLVLSYASTLAQQAFGGKGVSGYRGEFETGGTVPLSFLVGTIAVPGKLEYRNTWGDVGGTPNAYLVDVISFGDMPITAFTGEFIDTQPVTISTGDLRPQGYTIPEFTDATHRHLFWFFKDGTQTTADVYLTGKFGADADRPWLSDMIGRGVPFLIHTALINDNLFSGWPSYMGVFQGIKLYDPRLDTSAGGSGSQDIDDQSTWAWSDNPVVIIYNILLGITYDGTKLWGGGVRQYQLPYGVWSAAMDACDELVDLEAGGTEKRFRAGREIFVNEVPSDVITELLIGANARIAPAADGQFYVLVGVPADADGTFTDSDVLASQPAQLDLFPNIDSVINGATATYLEPLQAWEAKETAPYYRSDLEAADDNRRQLQGLTLNTTFSGTQAQRILKAVVEESRRFVRHVVALPPGFGIYRVLQTLAWTSDENGYSDKLFLIIVRTEDPWGNIILGLQEIDPTDHDWVPGTDERPLTFAPLTPIKPPPQPMTGWSVAPYTFPDAAGSLRRIGIEVSYAGELQDIRAVRIQVREDFGAGNTVFDSGATDYDITDADPVTRAITWAGIVPETDYEVRGIFLPFDGSGRETEWSDWLAVTTPAQALSLSDLGIDIIGMQRRTNAALRVIQETLQDFNATFGNISALHQDKIKTLREDLSTAFETAEVSYKREVQIYAGPGSAMFERTEAFQATLDAATVAITSTIGGSATTLDGATHLLALAVDELTLTIPDLATVTALSALSDALDVVDGQVSASATALLTLQGQFGYSSGQATILMSLTGTPSAGWDSQIAIQTSSTGGGSAHNSGIYLEATASASRIVIDTDQLALVTGGVLTALFDAGTAYLTTARIRNLDATNITAAKIDAGLILQNGTTIEALIHANAVTDAITGTSASSFSGGTAWVNNTLVPVISYTVPMKGIPMPVSAIVKFTLNGASANASVVLVLEAETAAGSGVFDEIGRSKSSGTIAAGFGARMSVSGTIAAVATSGNQTVRVSAFNTSGGNPFGTLDTTVNRLDVGNVKK